MFEMIPFVPTQKKDGKKTKEPTKVSLLDESGEELGVLGKSAVKAKTVVIDRGGFGVRIELDRLLPITRGTNNTILIELAKGLTPASEVGLEYRLVPFGA